ncbi:MAG: ROK family transcriptional regulator [Phyllobacteriaceae bacterium]|nr:ROK family transcriptional regulator [Phyllobacteriaceae bacterium]
MKSIARHDDMRRHNRRLVLDALRRGAPLSRTDICLRTGLSPATVSAFSAALIGEGVLVEDAPSAQSSIRRGRPQTGLALNPSAASVLTLVLTVNAMRAAVFDYAGNRLADAAVDFAGPAKTEAELVDAVVSAGRKAIHSAGLRGPLRSVTAAVQGIADAGSRTILWSPFTPARNVRLADALETVFDAPAMLFHDCAMIVKALRRRDPARHGADFVAVLQSEGIGMGLHLKGAVFSGARSSAGEFGHTVIAPGGARCRCGRRGCVEAYASNYAIWRRASGGDPDIVPERHFGRVEMAAIAESARAGDDGARAAFAEAGRALGLGLGNLFALTDPLDVSIVGPGGDAFDLTEAALREAIGETFAGAAGAAVAITCYPDEQELAEDGCRITALGRLDDEVFATGESPARAAE